MPTTFGKMMELRCVVSVIRHGDRTPKQKMKLEVKHPMWFDLFKRMNGYDVGNVKLKKPKHLQEVLDIARYLITEIEKGGSSNDVIEEKKSKLEQVKYILEMYGHFSGINRKVQLKYQTKSKSKGTSSEETEQAKEVLSRILFKFETIPVMKKIILNEYRNCFCTLISGNQKNRSTIYFYL